MKPKQTITTNAPLEKGDYITMEVIEYRRKYWFFGRKKLVMVKKYYLIK